MMSPGAWGAIPRGHYGPMTHTADGPGFPAEPFRSPMLVRLLRIVLAVLLAGSAILLAG